MHFDLFRSNLNNYLVSKGHINISLPTDEFLFWLIGFAEGDGCFTVNKRNEFSFIIVQGNANKNVLERIWEKLQLGHILSQSARVSRLLIQKQSEVQLILQLFNGNIVLPTRKKQFEYFFTRFTKHKFLDWKYQNNSNFPTFNNTWLLGFTEAEGCFTVSLLSNSLAFRTRFFFAQKGDINLPILSRCIQVFNTGFIEGHSQKDNYSFVVSGLKNINQINAYFDKYYDYFLGQKKQSYDKFKFVNTQLQLKKHLDGEGRKELIKLAGEINSIYRKFK